MKLLQHGRRARFLSRHWQDQFPAAGYVSALCKRQLIRVIMRTERHVQLMLTVSGRLSNPMVQSPIDTNYRVILFLQSS